jgi:hypothetical protein
MSSNNSEKKIKYKFGDKTRKLMAKAKENKLKKKFEKETKK